MELVPDHLSDPFRLRALWETARAIAASLDPRDQRKRRIDAVLLQRGVFARMQAAARLARSREFSDALGAARAEREAARNEDDLAAICRRILEQLGVDMTGLQVRLRRRTDAELARAKRRGQMPRRAASLALRITPTLETARAAVAAVDGQVSEGLASEISETEASTDSGADPQAGQATISG